MFNLGGPTAAYTPDQTLALDPTYVDTFSTQWAEVAYFLLQTGTTDDPTGATPTGNPLFGLYRAQHLLVPKTDTANELDSSKLTNNSHLETYQTTLNSYLLNNGYYAGVSCFLGGAPDNQLVFNSPADVANSTATFAVNGVTVRTTGM